MVFNRVRRIGRAFAVVLLAWAAADAVDYGACAGHQDLCPVSALAAVADARSTAPGQSGAAHDHVRECFCCSPYVDVQTAFHVAHSYTVAWALPPEAMARPLHGASRLYHPPLA